MKELIYPNFQLTRATGVPTMVVVDGVSIEMRKRGGAPTPAPAKAKAKKAKKPRRPAKANRTMEPAPEQPAKTSKAAVRRTEAAPQ